MLRKKRLLSLLLALVTVLSLTVPAAARTSTWDPLAYPVDTTYTSQGSQYFGVKTELSKAFSVAAGILRGDAGGNPRWGDGLSRIEAAIMVLRLMGLDGEAAAAAARPCPFTDVPGWAVGYATLAYEKGVSGGVGGGRFGPNDPCSVQDFITMLFRLTNLTEGRDYSWATALDDFLAAVLGLGGYQGTGWPHFGLYRNTGIANVTYYYEAGGLFTREAAADVLYFMLSVKAGPDDESLGDILAYEYGMSDMLLFNHLIRRTAWKLDESSITRGSLTGSSAAAPDYAYLYACQSGSHWEALRQGRIYDREEYFAPTPEIQALTEQLIAGKTTDMEKADAICMWITTHIYYDYEEMRSRSTDGESTLPARILQERRGICGEFSRLTAAMMRAAGLECYVEQGQGRNNSHAWNLALLDGEWTAIDNTWDSGAVRLRYELNPGDGYRYGNEVPADFREPGAEFPATDSRYFHMELDEFYSTHILRPEPLIMTRTMLKIPQNFG